MPFRPFSPATAAPQTRLASRGGNGLIVVEPFVGVLELKADPILPVNVRNIEKQMAFQQMSNEAKTFSTELGG